LSERGSESINELIEELNRKEVQIQKAMQEILVSLGFVVDFDNELFDRNYYMDLEMDDRDSFGIDDYDTVLDRDMKVDKLWRIFVKRVKDMISEICSEIWGLLEEMDGIVTLLDRLRRNGHKETSPEIINLINEFNTYETMLNEKKIQREMLRDLLDRAERRQ